MKKKILLFGTVLAAAIPVTTVVSCGGSTTKKPPTVVGPGNVRPKPVKQKRKVSNEDISLWNEYQKGLISIAKAMKSVENESSIKYLKTRGIYPKTMYFVGKNEEELKKLAKPILEKLGFSNDKKIPKNWNALKEGESYPDTNKRGASIYNNFKIGYKDEKSGKFGIYQDENKANRYDTAGEAVDVFLKLKGSIQPTSGSSNLLKFLEIGTGFKKKYPLINSFTKEFNDLGIELTNELKAVNKTYLSHNAKGDEEKEKSIFNGFTEDKKTELKKVVDKWIPSGKDGNTIQETQTAIVIDASDGRFTKGSTTHPFSFKVKKDLGKNVSEGLKSSQYFIVYGGLGNSKSGNLSKKMDSSDFLKGIEKFAIIDTGLYYHHKQIVFMFIKMKKEWMSWSDLLKYNDKSAKFILEEYWAKKSSNNSNDESTVFKDPVSSSNSVFKGEGLDKYQNGKFKDLVEYVKNSFK